MVIFVSVLIKSRSEAHRHEFSGILYVHVQFLYKHEAISGPHVAQEFFLTPIHNSPFLIRFLCLNIALSLTCTFIDSASQT
jgi:hypothetical protein